MVKKCIVLLMLWLSAILVFSLISCNSKTDDEKDEAIEEAIISEEEIEETQEVTAKATTKPAEFTIENLVITPEETTAGESCQISVEVSNIGKETGQYEAVLKVDGQEYNTRRVDIQGGETKELGFTYHAKWSMDTEQYNISIGNLSDRLIIRAWKPDCQPCQQPDKGFRAVHMAGNWGATANIRWGYVPPSEDYLDFLHRINANWVGISVGLHYDGSMDSSVEREYKGAMIPTFTDEALTIMINTLHACGYNVYLTLAFEAHEAATSEYPVRRWQLGDPNMPFEDPKILPEKWPWAIDHPDHERFVAEFWQTYAEQAVYFAKLAEDLGVEMYSLGTETDRFFRTRSGGYWPNDFASELKTMVDSARSVYSGLLTYDMHFSTLTANDFYGPGSNHLWEDLDLDIVGISAYFKLADTIPTTLLSVNDLEKSWQQVFTDYLIPLQDRNPDLLIVFTEFGYLDAIEAPFQHNYNEHNPPTFIDSNQNGIDDGEEVQANIYEAFFNINERYNRLVVGAFLWGHNWTSYNQWIERFAVRDRLAEDVVAAYYAMLMRE